MKAAVAVLSALFLCVGSLSLFVEGIKAKTLSITSVVCHLDQPGEARDASDVDQKQQMTSEKQLHVEHGLSAPESLTAGHADERRIRRHS